MTQPSPAKVYAHPDTNISAFIYPTLRETLCRQAAAAKNGAPVFFYAPAAGPQAAHNHASTPANGSTKQGCGQFFNTESAIFSTERTDGRK